MYSTAGSGEVRAPLSRANMAHTRQSRPKIGEAERDLKRGSSGVRNPS